jgi:hypothetical protein
LLCGRSDACVAGCRAAANCSSNDSTLRVDRDAGVTPTTEIRGHLPEHVIMKVDLYTKSVLTVIAACLVYLCFGRPGPMPAVAQAAEPKAAPQLVKIDGIVPIRVAAVERMQNPQTGQWSEWQTINVTPVQR